MDEEEKVEKENAENFDVINEVKDVDKTKENKVFEEEIITDKLDLKTGKPAETGGVEEELKEDSNKEEPGTEKAKTAEVWEDNIQVESNFDNIICNFLQETLIKC